MEWLTMYENTIPFILIALLVAGLLVWRIKPEEFRQLVWYHLALAAALFWGALALALVLYSWGYFYSYFTPGFFRWLAPLAALLIYPLWSLLMRWIAVRLPLHPLLGFCLLGGLQGIFEHGVAMQRFNLLEVPLLAGSSPWAVYLLAFFEYAVYWGLVACLAVLISRLLRRFRSDKTELDRPKKGSHA
jgi:hypothetical protein